MQLSSLRTLLVDYLQSSGTLNRNLRNIVVPFLSHLSCRFSKSYMLTIAAHRKSEDSCLSVLSYLFQGKAQRGRTKWLGILQTVGLYSWETLQLLILYLFRMHTPFR